MRLLVSRSWFFLSYQYIQEERLSNFSTVLISSLKETLFSTNLLILIVIILNQADTTITTTLLFGNSKYSNEISLEGLNAIIDFILTSKRFDENLLES